MKYLAITAILCLILAGASFAGNVTMTEVITGGGLTLTMPSDFSFLSTGLGGSDIKITQMTKTYAIEDSRGTGVGWNLGFQIDQFKTSGTPQRTIETNKFELSIGQAWITCVYGQAVDTTNGPKTFLGSTTVVENTEVEAIHSLSGYGMGKYSIDCNHRLWIPASAYAGTYTATLTATLNAVP